MLVSHPKVQELLDWQNVTWRNMADFCVAHYESKQSAPYQAISSESILTKFYWAIEAHGRLEWVNIALLISDTKI